MAKKTNKKTDKVDKEDKKKVALFTMCSDNLVEVCLTMLFSFLYNNEWFKQEGDIIILCDNNICPLSTDNREKFINFDKFDEYFFNYFHLISLQPHRNHVQNQYLL